MEFDVIDIENPSSAEIIIGQGNFTVKTIDDLFNTLVSSAPGIKFGVAMNEAKPRLTRLEGNESSLKELAGKVALKLGAGHIFVIYIKNAFPIHCLNAIKVLPTVASIYVATSNPLQVIVMKTSLGKSIVGVCDGTDANKIENLDERKQRKELLTKFGYTSQ